MARYAWYTRVTDALHRLTILTLLGGGLYLGSGVVYTIYMNTKSLNDKQSKLISNAPGAGDDQDKKQEQ
ncbi:hypothetical protein TBLA_0G03630 [Henningerozyma blattae CBS 6284]|uniref:Uncharacterized protein n=1 Tax=Henningerozyma blattae (strain ATCC 34711 / CBS 6284 / DSM 70876 / NBRC 10599 / NRRL Y-10934 / UCD 77-7) TaxID=1071380 RepID=I2H7E5_HENB6|nr:hypothetical protein TBLA_0G03630 [Tetrapisispora blattae CBS 6284]CCH62297.1 hypothetical protein TBLA_0G03630 [Tetrapisispora blattae CBS 6284]